jgi:hypothetical protein
MARDARALPRLMSPGLPAFADRLRVALEIDIFNAFFYCVGRVFEFFLHSAENRPEKREREKTPVDAAERRFQFYFFLVLARGVTDRETDRETGGKRADDHRDWIFAKEKLGPLARRSAPRADLFPATRPRFQYAGRLAPSPPRIRVLSGPERLVIHKIIFDRIHH